MFEGNWNFPFDSVIKEKEQAITEFSEGSESLENLLTYCFDNNIETLSCCAGHEELPICTAYLVFVLNDETIAYINNLLEYFFNKERLNYYDDLKESYEQGSFISFGEYHVQVPNPYGFFGARTLYDPEKRYFGFYFNGENRNKELKQVLEILKTTKDFHGPYQYNGFLNLIEVIKKRTELIKEEAINEDIKFLLNKANYPEDVQIKHLVKVN